MLGKISAKGKDFFPSGYELKTGSYITSGLGLPINVPANIIPISLKVKGHIIQENRSSSAVGYVRDNNGKELIRFEGIANEQARDDAYVNTTIDLMNLFGYKFDLLKSIKSFTSAMNGSYNQTVLEITAWLEKIGGGVLNPLIKKSSTFLRKVMLAMFGRVITNNQREYVGYKIMRGTKDVVSTVDNGLINRLISQEIIPLTFKLEWSGTAKWYIHFAMQSTPIGWINGFIWSGGGKETCMTYMDVESLYGLEYLKKCKYFGGNATNATGTYKISIVKWLEKVGA